MLKLTTTTYRPYTAQILGDLGADIIPIEATGGNIMRNVRLRGLLLAVGRFWKIWLELMS